MYTGCFIIIYCQYYRRKFFLRNILYKINFISKKYTSQSFIVILQHTKETKTSYIKKEQMCHTTPADFKKISKNQSEDSKSKLIN